jgi:hypothetical protein
MMTRDDLNALLPFHANGTLAGAELAALDAALATDADLRSDLAALQAIRETMQAEEVQSPGDLGLARLMRDVEAETRVDMAPPAANDNVVPLARLRIWQVAAAVVLAFGLGVNMLPDMGAAPEMESAMSDGSAPAAEQGFALASGDSADFTVIFAPDATEAQIRGLLLDAGVEITGGPSALGLYGLGLLESGTDDAARSVLAASGIIEELQ